MMSFDFESYLNPRTSGQFIRSNARNVNIDESAVVTCAEKILDDLINDEESSLFSTWSSLTGHIDSTDVNAADWVFITDALNFCFWYLDGKQYSVTFNGQQQTGYFALCCAITNAMKNNIPICDASFYSNISMKQLRTILMSDNGCDIPLIEKRLEHLHQCGSVLLKKFGGSFRNVIALAENSAVKLLKLVVDNFACFNDVAVFDGKNVSILKRAQILISDLNHCFNGTDYGTFYDIDELTMFADYRVPQVLNYFGVLSYSDELINVLKNAKILPPGCRYEVEIRGCSIDAVEQIVKHLKHLCENRKFDPTKRINSILVDNYLWLYRRKWSDQLKDVPYHRCITHFY